MSDMLVIVKRTVFEEHRGTTLTVVLAGSPFGLLVGCGMSSSPRAPFDTSAWIADGDQHWHKPNGVALVITTAAPTDLANDARFRNAMRDDVVARGGGLVSADVVGHVGRVVAKFPQTASGMTYEGTLLFACGGASYRTTIRVPETGRTGVRDAIVLDTWWADANPKDMGSWMQDPYDPTRRDKLMRNVSEAETYDAKFPNHPLTIVRGELATIFASLART
jgi:hypothetical protein